MVTHYRIANKIVNRTKESVSQQCATRINLTIIEKPDFNTRCIPLLEKRFHRSRLHSGVVESIHEKLIQSGFLPFSLVDFLLIYNCVYSLNQYYIYLNLQQIKHSTFNVLDSKELFTSGVFIIGIWRNVGEEVW